MLGHFLRNRATKKAIREIAAVGATAEAMIGVVQTEFSAADREWIARNLYYLVLQIPRGEPGVEIVYRAERQHTGPRDPKRIAVKLAGGLIVTDAVAVSLGAGFVEASFYVTAVQAQLESFLTLNGMPTWRVPYTIEYQFEEERSRILSECGLLIYPAGAKLIANRP